MSDRSDQLYQEIEDAIEAKLAHIEDKEHRNWLRDALWEGATIASKLICHKTRWIDESDEADWWKQ